MDSTDFTVREATTDDIPVLVDYMVDLALHVSGDRRETLTSEARERLILFLADCIEDTEKLIVVACESKDEANRVIGMGNIQIWRSPSLWDEAEAPETLSGFIDDLWVDPDYRRLGVMDLILTRLLDYAEQHRIKELILEYSIANKEAASVWSKLGFETIGVRSAASVSTVRSRLRN